MKSLLGCMCLCALFGTAAQAEDLQRTILDKEKQYLKATLNEDSAGTEKLLWDQHISTWASGLVHDKKTHVASLGKHYVVESLGQKDIKVNIFNDDTAIVTGLEETDAKLNGKATASVRRFTHVWIKQKGEWRLASIHNSSAKK